MTEEPSGGVSGALFQPIKTLAPERSYRYRSLAGLTFATIALVGVNGLALVAEFAGVAGRWALLLQMQRHAFTSRDVMVAAAHSSDAFVRLAAVSASVTLLAAYVVGSFWIYNGACNIRALGARGMQITPGWAVGWFAVPFAALVMPFQGVEEIYQASASPVGWQRLHTPLLLRVWWGAWLLGGVGGSLLSLVGRAMTTLPDLITANQLLLADVTVRLSASALFLVIVWRAYRAQSHSRSYVQQTAQVFA